MRNILEHMTVGSLIWLFVFLLVYLLIIIVAILIDRYGFKKHKNTKSNTPHYSKETYKIPGQNRYSPTFQNPPHIKSQDEKALEFLNDDHYMNEVGFKLGLCRFKGCQFFHQSEAIFYFQAKAFAIKYGIEIYSKVRIADIIYVPNADVYSNNALLERAIENKHFDFVICKRFVSDGYTIPSVIPRLIVEIDGASHDDPARITRDDFVDKLISRAKQHGNAIEIIHLRRELQNGTTVWRTIRCDRCGSKETEGNLVTVDELLAHYFTQRN